MYLEWLNLGYDCLKEYVDKEDPAFQWTDLGKKTIWKKLITDVCSKRLLLTIQDKDWKMGEVGQDMS